MLSSGSRRLVLLRQLGSLQPPVWPPRPPVKNAMCPIEACRGSRARTAQSLLEVSRVEEPNYRLVYGQPNSGADWSDHEAHKVHKVDKDTGVSIYNVIFKPGHFTCLKCDPGTCSGCDVICDLSQCLGEFYQQECWCRKDTAFRLKKPLWWFRKYDARFMTHDSVYQFWCDNDCRGGICETDGLQCKRFEEACKPWWWCNLPPPRTDNLVPKDGWPAGFSYEATMTLLQKNKTTTTLLQKNKEKKKLLARRQKLLRTSLVKRYQRRLDAFRKKEVKRIKRQLQRNPSLLQRTQQMTQQMTTSGSGGTKFEPNDFGKLNFQNGRFMCEMAALPPPVQNPATYLWDERGYIIFKKDSCKEVVFDSKCFCWNQNAYLKGQDPMTSEFSCDNTCKWGP